MNGKLPFDDVRSIAVSTPPDREGTTGVAAPHNIWIAARDGLWSLAPVERPRPADGGWLSSLIGGGAQRAEGASALIMRPVVEPKPGSEPLADLIVSVGDICGDPAGLQQATAPARNVPGAPVESVVSRSAQAGAPAHCWRTDWPSSVQDSRYGVHLPPFGLRLLGLAAGAPNREATWVRLGARPEGNPLISASVPIEGGARAISLLLPNGWLSYEDVYEVRVERDAVLLSTSAGVVRGVPRLIPSPTGRSGRQIVYLADVALSLQGSASATQERAPGLAALRPGSDAANFDAWTAMVNGPSGPAPVLLELRPGAVSVAWDGFDGGPRSSESLWCTYAARSASNAKVPVTTQGSRLKWDGLAQTLFSFGSDRQAPADSRTAVSACDVDERVWWLTASGVVQLRDRGSGLSLQSLRQVGTMLDSDATTVSSFAWGIVFGFCLALGLALLWTFRPQSPGGGAISWGARTPRRNQSTRRLTPVATMTMILLIYIGAIVGLGVSVYVVVTMLDRNPIPNPLASPSAASPSPSPEPLVVGPTPSSKPSSASPSPSAKPSVPSPIPSPKPSVAGTAPSLKPSVASPSPSAKP